LQALADAEELHPDVTLVTGHGQHEGGIAAAKELLRKGIDFTAVFAFNDLMAMGVIAALQRAGRRVPEDISVVGFDDIPQTSMMFPSVTTVAQPAAELGQRSVGLLLERIKNQDAPPQRLVLSTTLVERESCRAVSGIAAANGDGAVQSRPAARAP
jgi:DNA-binding LacI/PurR family transcriptional regulator